MKIKKDTPCIFVRISDYLNYDFVEEHKKVLDENGYVWLLKIGKRTKQDFIKEVLENGGGLIIKSTAKHGHKFYFCNIASTKPDETLIYPEYYQEIFNYENYDIEELKETCSWYKIDKMILLKEEIVDKFVTISTNRSLLDCGKNFRVAQMHLKALEDLNI